jgi:putative colanic acid biosynthesis acetyltransferase WcaF
MEEFSCLGPYVNCYNVDVVKIMRNSIVSQNVTLCTATHNIHSDNFELITKQIIIYPNVWVASEAFIGPGVTIFEGAVVGARSCVFNNIEAWNVVRGNPSKFLKIRGT